MYSCHFMLLWHCLTLGQANSGHWPGRKKEKKNKQKEWNIFSVGLMNKIESAKNLLSRSSAAAENSRIIQLRRRAEERRQPFLFEKSTQSVFLNCMVSCQGALQKKGEKNPYFLLLLVDIKSGKLKN